MKTNTENYYNSSLDFVIDAIKDFGINTDKLRHHLDIALYDAFADGYKTCLDEHFKI